VKGVLAGQPSWRAGFPISQRMPRQRSRLRLRLQSLMPLSGAYSRNGNLGVQGTKALMNWYNERGGIKSLGGRQNSFLSSRTIRARWRDLQTRWSVSVEILTFSLPADLGSSFAMAATEVTERLGIPFVYHGLFGKASRARLQVWFFHTRLPRQYAKVECLWCSTCSRVQEGKKDAVYNDQ